MSLINQMLQDLDARRAAHGVGSSLPNDVRPLPQQQASRLPLILGCVVFLALLGGFVFYQFGGRVEFPYSAAIQPIAVQPAATPPTSAAPPVQAAEQAVAEAVPPVSPLQELEGSLRLAEALDLAVEQPVELKPEPKTEAKPVVKPKAPVIAEKPAVESKAPLASARVAEPELLSKPEVTPKASAKSAKPGGIERNEVAASPRERAESEYRKALAAVNQGRLEEAIDDLHNALRHDVLHSASRQLLVTLLLQAKRPDEAVQELQDGLHLQPAQLNWAMSLARLQVSRGDLNGAWKTLEFSMPAAGSNADYQGFAGHVLHRLKRDKESAEHYQAAVRLSPGDGRWWLGLGLALDAEGRSAEAREAFMQARNCGNLSQELNVIVEKKLR